MNTNTRNKAIDRHGPATERELHAALSGMTNRAVARALRALSDSEISKAWENAIGALLEPSSQERRALQSRLEQSSRLSSANLQASLEAVCGGMRGPSLAALARRAALRPMAAPTPIFVVLAGNVPGLAAQTLLPALLRRRPVLFKSASAEPHFTPALIEALVRRLPTLAGAYAALCWTGGNHRLEHYAAARSDPILAYGGTAAISSLRERFPRLVEHGPKGSIAVIDATTSTSAYDALARDVALLDQRGCLSVRCVLSTTPTQTARALADSLERCASVLPPGEPTLEEAAELRRFVDESMLLGLALFGSPQRGLVVLDPRPRTLTTSWPPALRTVTVHPLASARDLVSHVRAISTQLQGVVLATAERKDVALQLRQLGTLRITPPGEMQRTDALWHDGAQHPVDRF